MPPPPSFHDHINRAKAVGNYFHRLVFGSGNDVDVPIVFYPNIELLRARFQSKYGHRGEYLIEALGRGYVPSI